MQKLFFEVFPTLEIPSELKSLFREVAVERVTTTREKKNLRIYLVSSRLIPKKDIFGLEKAIKEQLFAAQPVAVKIIERFTLSKQYNARTLLEAYRDSILAELHEYDRILCNFFRHAKLSFLSDRELLMTLPDTVIARDKADDLVSFLEKVICVRCGQDCIISLTYEQQEESGYKKNADILMENQIRSIVENSTIGNELEHRMQQAGENIGAATAQQNVGQAAGSTAGLTADQTVRTTAGQTNQQAAKKSAENAGKGYSYRRSTSYGQASFGRTSGSIKKSDHPDVIYGRDVEEPSIPIEQIIGEMGEVTIHGKVLRVDTREIRNEKTIISFALTDFTDSIMIKLFARNDMVSEILSGVKAGAFLKVKGITTIDRYDGELSIGSVVGIKKINDFTVKRQDQSASKRVELHCHTKMSDMDGVSDVKDIIARAIEWGHKAIAITDHGNVQAFPDANHALPKGSDFKVIYGTEAYLVDDEKQPVEHPAGQSLSDCYVVFDLETTGFSPVHHKIIEIGAVKVVEGKITERFSTFVNPHTPIPFEIENLTKIRDEMVLDAPDLDEVLPNFLAFCEGAVMVAHNAGFDMSFIAQALGERELPCNYTVVDTVSLARILLPSLNRYKLDTVAKALSVSLENHHRAVDDAACTAEIFIKFLDMLSKRGIVSLDEINHLEEHAAEVIKKLPTHHAILLATNDLGRINLYRLISSSHLTYYHKQPRIPKSELVKYREGILVGSACEAGELYQALLRGSSQEEIARLVRFYDYLEIQPRGNNAFMLRGENPKFSSMEELLDINRQIVALGEAFHKPVVATCDVHFLDPEDEIYRRIIMTGKGFKDADEQAPLYLHTTEEMLEEFAYLGSEKAEEVVITNPNRIADMCERIEPVRPDKCPPVIENSDQMLRDICYNRAHELYGESLPEVVTERLERELHSIISNGFAVMYIIAQKLVWKSNEDGYLVGSRGSVGSSFVATMAGITEVNPLSPHYYCEQCHFSDFDSEEVKAFAGRSGCDMPDRTCPVCGASLKKDGFDIPFETFLGFKGNKEPDIDLNFSGEYQSKAHKYTEVIFGEGQTFRAGTIGTLADKTAYGYIKHYYEDRGVQKRNCEIERIVQGCVGVRRTTGQHPGGIIVLPLGEEIHSFTPVQHPANDMTTDIITTHFDYHSIDHNLLKLDILGHDDPTMIRMLEDLTGIDAKKIPLDDPTVMTLFRSTEALGISPEDIGGCPLGSLGIPEFGTDFVIQMLQDTKPTSFSDLIRISGLSHGTDVWLGNAQTLISEGKATISNAICTRDDIMTYLISMGLDSEESFKIMEAVRKGTVAKKKCEKWPEWEEDMKAHGVPDWYIWSCTKIQYMFPKAHAAAYVMMAWRIAYCKVFYPLAYYAAYFSIRATAFQYELMCQGKDKLNYYIADYERRKDSLTNKEQDTLKDMRIVQEMYARGFEFHPIDIYRSKAEEFQIIDGKLLPSLNTIDGLGDKAAEAIVEAAKDGPFLSQDDFRDRTKVSKTVVQLMADLGLLGDLPQSNQLSLFD